MVSLGRILYDERIVLHDEQAQLCMKENAE